MNILIVKLSAIGDVIHTLPALAALRRLYPDADITWVVEEAAADLLTDHPHLDRILISRRKTWLRDLRRGRIAAPLKEMRAFLRELRSRPYDLVIDFHGLLKSAVIVLISGGKRKLGYDSMQEGSGLFYSEKIPEAMEKHAVDRYLDFVRHLEGCGSDVKCSEETPDFTIPLGGEGMGRTTVLRDKLSQDIEAGEGLGYGKESGGGRKAERRFVAISPIAFWETKLWEDNKFAELGDRIRRELGIGVILTGGEAGPIEKIRGRMKTAAINLGGRTTLRELASLYRDASLIITTDSGPMHLAAAVGTPVVALFGPTDPARTGPYGPGHRIIRRELSCSPCFRKRCKAPLCMTEITVEEVFSTVKEILVKRNGNESFENHTPSARWTFFDPASPRFAVKTKLALKRSNSRLYRRSAAGAGAPKNLHCALPGYDFQSSAGLTVTNKGEKKMGINKELLEILACPKCKGEIRLTPAEDGLICERCRLLYEIREDIPIMLIDEAKPIEK